MSLRRSIRRLLTSELPDLSNELAEKVTAALKTARRPLLAVGLTFTRSKKAKLLLQFAEKQKIPFVTTLHGKGFLPESHQNWAGVIGRARRTDVKAFIDKADLILAVGYDPIEMNYEEWVAQRPIIHISSEAAEVSKDISFVWNKACDLDRAIEALSQLSPLPNAWEMDEWRRPSSNAGTIPPSGERWFFHASAIGRS